MAAITATMSMIGWTRSGSSGKDRPAAARNRPRDTTRIAHLRLPHAALPIDWRLTMCDVPCSGPCSPRSRRRPRSTIRISCASRNTTASGRLRKSPTSTRTAVASSASGRGSATEKTSQFPEIVEALRKWAARLEGTDRSRRRKSSPSTATGEPAGFQQLPGPHSPEPDFFPRSRGPACA